MPFHHGPAIKKLPQKQNASGKKKRRAAFLDQTSSIHVSPKGTPLDSKIKITIQSGVTII